jgi:GAF domain-containing protein
MNDDKRGDPDRWSYARKALARVADALPSEDERRTDLRALDLVFDEVERLEKLALERERTETALRKNHAALMKLARSESLGGGALEQALREMTEASAECLDCARSSVWLYNADQTSIQCIEIFLRADRAHESGVELFAKDFPGYFGALKEERTIPAHDAHTDPRTSEFSAVYLTPLGINSMLDAPIRAGGRMIGVVCNEHIGPQRTWTAEEEQFAGSIADFVALAMESSRRRETEEQLRAMVEALESQG